MNNTLTKLINRPDRLGEVIRFGLVGGLATLLQYGIFVLFVQCVFSGGKTVPATIISYAISFVANFFLSNYFTFHTRPSALKGVGFTLSHLINMGMQVGLVAIFKTFMPASLTLLPAMAICVPVNYFLVRTALNKL